MCILSDSRGVEAPSRHNCFQDDGNSSPSQRAGDRGDRHIVGEAANHGGAAVTASIAQAALESLPFEGASEGSRLMALCQRCIEVRFVVLQCTCASVSVLSSHLPQSICHGELYLPCRMWWLVQKSFLELNSSRTC